MKDAIEEARRLVQSVRLESIRLVAASADCRIRSRRDVGEADLTYQTKASALGVEDGHLLVRVRVDVSVVSTAAASSPPAVDVSVTLELRYHVLSGLNTTDKEREAFAATTSVFNAWPYVREFVQSTIARMNLPPLTLPLARISGAKGGNRRISFGLSVRPPRKNDK
jgi:hypothetical protein